MRIQAIIDGAIAGDGAGTSNRGIVVCVLRNVALVAVGMMVLNGAFVGVARTSTRGTGIGVVGSLALVAIVIFPVVVAPRALVSIGLDVRAIGTGASAVDIVSWTLWLEHPGQC